ncbi:MAG: extracellular solute-binding protein [Acidimicrobiales bacterium]|nr:extracellular solute-binding protein [Acidimicrobiales bacterium]
MTRSQYVTTAAAVGLAGVLLAGGLAGCSSSAKATAPTSLAPATTIPRGSGPVDVLYAGSLVNTMEKQIGPSFDRATGYTFTGFSAGSDALAQQIKGKVRVADVFISASPTVNTSLEGASNGNWVSWYATFATAPLVLGYNSNSKFAADLKTKPWYQVITEPGFLLGRTDPTTDPKGKLTVTALNTAAQTYNEPALATLATNTSEVFPEETLVGRLQAGQLDAGFFYTSESTPASIPTISLTGLNLAATYTITVVNNAPDEAGAEAFVSYLLGQAGQAVLKQDGFELAQPFTVTGTGVPASLSSVLPSP